MFKVESVNPQLRLVEDEKPFFRIVNDIPPGMSKQIEDAVRDFIVSSHLPPGCDPQGFMNQTFGAMASATYLGQGGELWVGTTNGELWTYILATVGNDYDGRLSYTVTQAWVRADQRGEKWVKAAWEQVRERAKNCFCKHFAVISSRGKTDAYCRFLGKGFHYYAEILKEEL